jgi:hypothetical protein
MVKHQIAQLCTKRSQKASDDIICLDDNIKANLSNDETERTLQDNAIIANCKIEPFDVASPITIILSSEEEESHSDNEISNRQPHNHQLSKTIEKGLKEVNIKKYKCAQCYFRSDWSNNVSKQFIIAHWQVTFNEAQCIQVLDEEEATKTLAAYERNYLGNKIVCKPFKCGKCELRTTHKASAYFHMNKIHHIEIHEAKRQVEVLPFDES